MPPQFFPLWRIQKHLYRKLKNQDNIQDKMGNQPTVQHIHHHEKDESVHESSDGFHLLELHMPSIKTTGLGVGTILLVSFILVLIYFYIKRRNEKRNFKCLFSVPTPSWMQFKRQMIASRTPVSAMELQHMQSLNPPPIVQQPVVPQPQASPTFALPMPSPSSSAPPAYQMKYSLPDGV